MVSFAELKAKAEKAKDASVTAVSNTRDRYSSTPSSKVNWDPNWKRPPPPTASPASASASRAAPPPPPPRSRPDVVATGIPPFVVHRGPRPTQVDAGAPPYVPPPPPARAASGYPPHHPDITSIDWAHLSAEDKEAFFGWLDEFFSRYLGIEVGPGGGRAIPLKSSVMQESARPPSINLATRPHA